MVEGDRPSGSADRLQRRRAIVTGAGSGIGRAVALRLAGEGAAVGLVDVRVAAAERVGREIADRGGEAIARDGDVGNESSISSAVAAVVGKLGGLDIAVAAAGIAHPAATDEMPLEAWETIVRINLTGVFLTIKHAVPHLRDAGGGAIVTIGSVGSLVAAGQCSAYDATKGGVLQLTRAVAIEYVDDDIRANCVCPGVVATNLGKTSREVAVLADASGTRRPAADRIDVPMARQADPGEIAAAVAFLCSDDASFITGAALPVDGGFTAI